jgi:TetR/AcrR family transcriptional regulator, transcriptional repressor of bet genes
MPYGRGRGDALVLESGGGSGKMALPALQREYRRNAMPKLGMEPIRREQIRKAAAKLIAKRGFDRTTLRHVALAAKVSTGTINHYYPNKLAVLVDALLYASEWFQTRIKEAIAKAESGPDKLRALVHVGVFEGPGEVAIGQSVWIWALAESIRHKPLRIMIEERRQLFQAIIADVIRALDVARNMSEADIGEFAAELDAYLDGLCIHQVTGETRVDPEAVTHSLLAMAEGRAAGRPRSEGAGQAERRRQNAAE